MIEKGENRSCKQKSISIQLLTFCSARKEFIANEKSSRERDGETVEKEEEKKKCVKYSTAVGLDGLGGVGG